MTIPSEFTLLRYGKEIGMLPNYILDLLTKLLISFTVDVSVIQKPRISRVWILFSSSTVRVQLSHAYRKEDTTSDRTSLALEDTNMSLSLNISLAHPRSMGKGLEKVP